MVILVTGGSGSGKSAYAEKRITELCGTGQKYYLATMQVLDKEGERKVERHRLLRREKGFITIEQPADIRLAAGKLKQQAKGILLECMSNLVANEMFQADGMRQADEVAGKVVKEVSVLKAAAEHLVIVTNNVFEDGITYDAATMEYIRALGAVNERLAKLADEVVEVVVGIGVVMSCGS